MTTNGDETVTIDRTHFETILRRANFNPDDLTSAAVSISKSEYDGLKSIAVKYANLRQNLLRGGVGGETIDLLSQDDATIEQSKHSTEPATGLTSVTDHDDVGTTSVPPKDTRRYAPRGAVNDYWSYSAQPRSSGHTHLPPHDPHSPDWADTEAPGEGNSTLGGGPVGDSDVHNHSVQVPARPHYERQCARSVLLSNLGEGTTHADITEAIRGGQLLDIYLRPHDRTAAVSFLQAADAREFFDHVRRHDLYIKHKRVDIRWHDRQFTLPGHIASKIGIGATRNLVIRRCDPGLTEAAIRDDLEHIHNLIVIKVEFLGGSCYIRTNSVHNSVFARTCMMSRLKYKHCKIEWDADECCQPYDRAAPPQQRKDHPTRRSNGNSMANRFHLLDLDDNGDEDEISTAFSPTKSVGIAA